MNIKKIICSSINFDNLRFYDTCFQMKIQSHGLIGKYIIVQYKITPLVFWLYFHEKI